MKNEEHRGLWNSIQQFPLDDPHAAITFSHKLAAKQNWSPFFTERVVEEYRKFLFLCCISPNGASPSQAVDEAWHLHLTYTRSYWIDLCKNTLNKDIHHHPSRGGDEEDHKHHDWYAETLLLYESVFGSPPPDDIWPPPREQHTPLAEPSMTIRRNVLVLILMLLLLPFVISAYNSHVVFPFSLTGPEFLGFFPLLAISCIICYIIIQNEKYHHFSGLAATHFPENASIFEYTQFLYGTKRMIQTAILDLVRRNLLEVATDGTLMVYNNRYIKTGSEENPMIIGFLQEERSQVTYETIINEWYKEKPPGFAILQQLHELGDRKISIFKRNFLLLLPILAGTARIIQGMVNDKPVSYLILEMIALLIVCLIVVRKFSRKAMLFKKATYASQVRQHMGLLYEDKVVSDFATKGYEAINGFSDGLVLIALFGTLPFWDQMSEKVDSYLSNLSADFSYHNTHGDSGSGSSCGSGGGCGSSCGGGCGGGCGGCGS